MNVEHFTRFLPLACAGGGLFLAGVVNLLLFRQPIVIRVLATLLALGLAVLGAVALDQPGVPLATLRLLLIGFAVYLVCTARPLLRRAAGLVGAIHRPVTRFALLTVGGLGLMIASIVEFERVDDSLLDIDTTDLELVHGRAPSVTTDRAKATTDRGTEIVLKEVRTVRDAMDLAAAEWRTLRNQQLDDHVIRRALPADETNCHLQGEITHTAVVRYITPGQPVLVEGKWGNLSVFLHPVEKSTYGTEYVYYRSGRVGHLLNGLGGPAP
jgi:hypothetical protein